MKFSTFTSTLLLTVFIVASMTDTATFAQESTGSKPRLILDADTGNEIDDLYAIIRALRQDQIDVIGLNSAQWLHYLGQADSVQASQKLNEQMVKLLGRPDLPTPMGSEQPFGMPWGGEQARDSPAAQFIIQAARKTPADEKLIVVCIGASTNLASAIKLAPDIAPRINGYLVGFNYDWEKLTWNKSEFNVRRDLDAADYLLNRKELELHIMPTSVSHSLVFDRQKSFEHQAKMGPTGELLTTRWKTRFPDAKTWIMWDITVISALLQPAWATEEQVTTPPENTQRKVWMYRTIDHEKMQDDFWATSLQGSGR